MELAFACPACGRPVEGTLDGTTTSMTCPACQEVTALPEAPHLVREERFGICPVCGSEDLYQQRDFNRRLGLTLAAIGLLLGPFTSWISVLVAVALDAGLYLLVPPVAVCYACNAQVRGLPKDGLPPPFDIAIHDVYKFGKRHPPRREQAVAGPLATRLRLEGKEAGR